MNISNQVNGLWIKGELSPLEILTIQSFIANGYEFILWTYDEPLVYSQIENLIVKDAREIILENQVFSYKLSNQFGHGKGSYAGFSDVFRYQLLYLNGGWWVDMDVTCIKRFEFESPYVFRKSKLTNDFVVGNIMCVPKGCALMKKCFVESIDTVNADNQDWMLPINILNKYIQEENLEQYIYSFSNEDSWPVVSQLLTQSAYPPNWSAIHWMNEEFRRINIPKNIYLKESLLGQFYARFSLAQPIISNSEKIKYTFKVSRFYYALIHFRKETFISSMYYLGYNLFYIVSDFYFLKIKPRFDFGYYFKRMLGIKREDKS
jgi:hypothetical protein